MLVIEHHKSWFSCEILVHPATREIELNQFRQKNRTQSQAGVPFLTLYLKITGDQVGHEILFYSL